MPEKYSDKGQAQSPMQSTTDQYGNPAPQSGVLGAQGPFLMQHIAGPSASVDTAQELNKRAPVTVAFPPCADELLSLINTANPTTKDDVTLAFEEYFKFGPHRVILEEDRPGGSFRDHLDPGLYDCLLKESKTHGVAAAWPTECCICSPCVTLNGNRNSLLPNPPTPPALRRLFIGDLVWLFYFERMGIMQILGAILDAYACNGRLPISNGSLDPDGPGLADDILAMVLEVMVRQTKMGTSSSVRDRACAYRTSLGWTSDVARKLQLDTLISSGFNVLFHRFIFNALEFYKDKRLAVAIQSAAVPAARPSVATLITISDTIDLLKQRFEPFSYGRNYNNTLSGIVWVIAGMSVIRALRTSLGIPTTYNQPLEYIPAAYELLVMKRPPTQGDTNRYLVHRECANNGRDILLDMEVINHKLRAPGQELENWLTQIEGKVEAYRTAYRTLTGVDLGAPGTPVIEQQV